MQHVVTHIGETIPPEIYNNLDIVTKTLVDGTHAYVTEKMLKKRLAIAEKRKKRKNRKNHWNFRFFCTLLLVLTVMNVGIK